MRRLLAILIVIVLLPAAVYAEEMSRKEYIAGVRDYVGSMLQALKEVYDEDPEMDADYIFFTYSYLKAWMSLNTVCTAETVWNLKQPGLVVFDSMDSMVKGTEQTNAMLERVVDEKYEKWLNGELSDEDCMKTIMAIVNSYVLTEAEVAR